MNKFGAGVRLLTLAGIIRSSKYIAAAVYMSNTASQGRDLFQDGLSYLGPELDILAAVSVISGLALIIWGEYEKSKQRKKEGK